MFFIVLHLLRHDYAQALGETALKKLSIQFFKIIFPNLLIVTKSINRYQIY